MLMWAELALFAIVCCILIYVVHLIGRSSQGVAESLQKRMDDVLEEWEEKYPS